MEMQNFCPTVNAALLASKATAYANVQALGNVNTTGLFRGIPDVSQRGTHPVIRYDIPGGSLCYVFAYERARPSYGNDKYVCCGCKKRGKKIPIVVEAKTFFTEDPCMLPHVCLPSKSAKDETTRLVYKTCRYVSNTPALADKKPIQLFQEIGNYVDFHSSTDPNRRREMLHFFHGRGYHARENTLSRAVGKLRDKRVSMAEVPDLYSRFPDGTSFLHHISEDLHIYYSVEVIERACAAGLRALVADGVYDLQPDATQKSGQLYVLHGVTGNGVDVSLLYAITTRKTEDIYERIFSAIREAMTPPAHQDLRIVLDFEKAAVLAARKIFTNASVEGCAFHLARAWARKRNAHGLRQYIHGTQRCSNIEKWWKTIKGLIFLPSQLHRRVPALFQPPVTQRHAAYHKCLLFLEYLRARWYSGVFKGMWCKWDVADLRTSNIAESFNRQLGIVLGVKHPPMAHLIVNLQRAVSEAKGKLANVELRVTDGKQLKKKDLLRRRRVLKEMKRFKSIMVKNRGFLRTVTINTYCRRMSRYVTEKTF